ncbi:hypothetical protein EUGRSUZ_H05058 [Eucalyptus grandis]|uniref:Uncharacterized protein n=2 Tax=Eucalyptus grandis TaxID=71139 RepID=A0ACC3JZQ7_EUCGR|nr:hypothetical protein EUGRSUZ_H05058 [Eucalyptus grandis]
MSTQSSEIPQLKRRYSLSFSNSKLPSTDCIVIRKFFTHSVSQTSHSKVRIQSQCVIASCMTCRSNTVIDIGNEDSVHLNLLLKSS